MMLMARITIAAAFLFLTTSAFGQSSPGGTPGEFPEQLNLEAFWEQAFGLDYVEGGSAIVLGDELADGSIEVWVFDPNDTGSPEDGLFQIGGHFNAPHIAHELDWIEPINFSVAHETWIGSGHGQLWSFGGTLVGATGNVFHVSGLASSATIEFVSPVITTADMFLFAPTALHRNAMQALDAATDASLDVIPDDLSDLPNFVPGEGVQEADPDCAKGCENTLIGQMGVAFNNWENAKGDCGDLQVIGGGFLAGCTVVGGACFKIFKAPPPQLLAGCCVAGGVGGALLTWKLCMNEAMRDYHTAVDNAKALYIACMKNCGYVIAVE